MTNDTMKEKKQIKEGKWQFNKLYYKKYFSGTYSVSDSEEELCKGCPKGYTTAGPEATSIDQCSCKIYVSVLIKCVNVCNHVYPTLAVDLVR